VRRALLPLMLMLVACGHERREMIPWAWERREDLRFRGGTVAYLAETITLRGAIVDVRPRMQPLFVGPGTQTIPVIRIESDHPTLDDAQRRAAVAAIRRLGARVQIDFDATRSQRSFYRALLNDLHRSVPHITITALASWCSDDRWMDGLPIDDAIPMLFQMGGDDFVVRRRLERGEDFRDPRCRSSVGISLDDPPARVPPGRRVYVFNSRAWSPGDWHTAEEIVNRWK
jgi:hypothetical protein